MKAALVWMVVLCAISRAGAADEAPGAPHAVAMFTEHAPEVDGVIQPEEWANAIPILFPAAAGQDNATPPCEVRFLWTKEGLYLAFRTEEKTPAFGHIKQGEPVYEEDSFEVFIDHMGDHLQFYEIQSDPAGQTFFKNYVLTAPPRVTPEMRFTPEFAESELWRYVIPTPDGFRIASKLDPLTQIWSLEMFFPASFVNRRRGGGDLEPGVWRVNLVRHDWNLPKGQPGRQAAFMYWAPVLKGNPHNSPTAMGYLELKK